MPSDRVDSALTDSEAVARYAAYGVGSGFEAGRMAKMIDAIGERLPC